MEIKHYTYEEWLNINNITEEFVQCNICNGTGDCECYECGYKHDCSDCDGAGQINITFEEYEKIKKETEDKVKEYNKILENKNHG